MKKKMNPFLRSLYPPIKPYNFGFLEVGQGHKIYWETCGTPKGKPALFLHGGPGGGCQENHRRLFNPKKFNTVLFDQRGSGRSIPHACLKANTTQHLIADIEKLRRLLKIDRWLILGGSWGSTLALAYAQKYPKRVTGLVLRGIFAMRDKELDWFYNGGAAFLFPDLWEDFLAPLSPIERKDIIGSYRRRFISKNKRKRLEAALAWAEWERKTVALFPKKDSRKGKDKIQHALAMASIENHFFINNGSFKKGQLLRNAKKLKNIPGIIIQGRYDVVCPATTAWELHKNWPGSKLFIIPDAGHAYNEPGTLDTTIRATDAFAIKKK